MRVQMPVAAFVAAAVAPFACALPGDPWHRTEYCLPDGTMGVSFTKGTCEDSVPQLEALDVDVKKCTDLTETGMPPNTGYYADILQQPATLASGPILNLGQIQDVAIVFNLGRDDCNCGPAGRRASAVRTRQGGIETVEIPFPQGVAFSNIESFQIFWPGQVNAPVPLTPQLPQPIQNVQGDFEIAYQIIDANNLPALVRQPVSLASLNFAPSTLPCSTADTEGDQDIDVFDLILFLQNFNPTGQCANGQCGIADIDGDLDIDVFDLIAFLQAFDPNDPNCQP